MFGLIVTAILMISFLQTYFVDVLLLLFTKVESQIDELLKEYLGKVMKVHWSHI